MNDLSPAARELVESHRRGKVLTHADRERIKHKLMLRVATLGATTAATGTAVGMSLASKIALVAVGVTAVLEAGAYSLSALRERSPSQPVSSAQPAPVKAPEIVAPLPVPTEAARAPVDSAPVDTGRAEHPKKLSKHPALVATPAPVAPSDPEPELRVLREARDDLRVGRPESAYRRLEEYSHQHSGGVLAQERNALSVIAFCQWQPGPDARTRAAEFLGNSPQSPLASRVRSACEMSSKPSQ